MAAARKEYKEGCEIAVFEFVRARKGLKRSQSWSSSSSSQQSSPSSSLLQSDLFLTVHTRKYDSRFLRCKINSTKGQQRLIKCLNSLSDIWRDFEIAKRFSKDKQTTTTTAIYSRLLNVQNDLPIETPSLTHIQSIAIHDSHNKKQSRRHTTDHNHHDQPPTDSRKSSPRLNDGQRVHCQPQGELEETEYHLRETWTDETPESQYFIPPPKSAPIDTSKLNRTPIRQIYQHSNYTKEPTIDHTKSPSTITKVITPPPSQYMTQTSLPLSETRVISSRILSESTSLNNQGGNCPVTTYTYSPNYSFGQQQLKLPQQSGKSTYSYSQLLPPPSEPVKGRVIRTISYNPSASVSKHHYQGSCVPDIPLRSPSVTTYPMSSLLGCSNNPQSRTVYSYHPQPTVTSSVHNPTVYTSSTGIIPVLPPSVSYPGSVKVTSPITRDVLGTTITRENSGCRSVHELTVTTKRRVTTNGQSVT